MIKYQVGYGLKILFVGVNPHPGSDRRGIPFSNNKMFWYLLHDAGLIKESRDLLKDDEQLKKLYMHSFKSKYRFGISNMVSRPSRTANELKRVEAIPGRKNLHAEIKKYKPKVVCFVGKITYSLFIDSNDFTFGWQPDIESSKIYVMHSPNHGYAKIRIKELQEINNL